MPEASPRLEAGIGRDRWRELSRGHGAGQDDLWTSSRHRLGERSRSL